MVAPALGRSAQARIGRVLLAMRDEKPPTLADLDEKLRKAREAQSPKASATATHQTALAYRILADLVAGILVGLGSGWLLDSWFGTRPRLILVMLGLGFAAGIWNAVKAIRQMDADARKADRRPE
jgi:ATP synthase protein I